MIPRPPRPDAPGSLEYVAIPVAWASADPHRLGRQCRHITGPNRKQCRRPAVIALNRGYRRYGPGDRWSYSPSWWGYCELEGHHYGFWIEDGKVMQWALRERTPATDRIGI